MCAQAVFRHTCGVYSLGLRKFVYFRGLRRSISFLSGAMRVREMLRESGLFFLRSRLEEESKPLPVPYRLFYCTITIAVLCFVFAAVRSRRPEKAKRPTYACMTAGSCRCLSHPDQRALLRPSLRGFFHLVIVLVAVSIPLL